MTAENNRLKIAAPPISPHSALSHLSSNSAAKPPASGMPSPETPLVESPPTATGLSPAVGEEVVNQEFVESTKGPLPDGRSPTDVETCSFVQAGFPQQPLLIAEQPELAGQPTPNEPVTLATPANSPVSPLVAQLVSTLPSVPDKIGRFDIVRLLGRGGFGEVYLGRDPTLLREVAIKIPSLKQATSAEAEREFIEEARKLVHVQGSGIVIVYEVFPVTLADQPRICIVQQFIDGENLADWLATQPKPIKIDRIAYFVAEIATILSSIHRQNFVHRDLKPANIMIDKAGRPFVLDFGLALRGNQRQERSGIVEGTWIYMSPEQVRGETHRMDDRSDIWSLGVIMYELFSGQRPFGGSNTKELSEAIQTWEPRPLRQLIADFPPVLDRICLKCLQKPSTNRYATMAELAADLRN
jgi:hypothetical protein